MLSLGFGRRSRHHPKALLLSQVFDDVQLGDGRISTSWMTSPIVQPPMRPRLFRRTREETW